MEQRIIYHLQSARWQCESRLGNQCIRRSVPLRRIWRQLGPGWFLYARKSEQCLIHKPILYFVDTDWVIHPAYDISKCPVGQIMKETIQKWCKRHIPSREASRGFWSKISIPCILPKSSNRSKPVDCSRSVGTVPGFAPGARRSDGVLASKGIENSPVRLLTLIPVLYSDAHIP